MSKTRLLFMSAIKTLFSNKKRMVLSSLGIALSAFLFVFLQLVAHLPQQVSFAEYQNFPKDSILFKGDLDYNRVSQLTKETFKYTYTTAPIEFAINNRLNVKIINYGVDKNFLDFPVLHTKANDSLEITQLLYGRSFTSFDYAKKNLVIIINETTSYLLFDEETSVGKVIQLVDHNDQIYDFTVVGVVRDTPSVYANNQKVSKQNELGHIPILELYSYIPYTVATTFSGISVQNLIVRSKYEPESMVSYVNSILNLENVQNYTFKEHYQNFNENIVETNNVLLVIKTIVMLFSTINLTVILLFSLKERVFEIGIKKALGASNQDIMIQFQIEAFLIGFLGSIIGVLFSAYLSALFSLKVSFDLGILITHISFLDYIYNILFIQLFVLIASVIPCYVAANKNILESLRID
jgi:putative ABC transport system permease protein